MKQLIYKCDHCGKELDEMKDYIDTETMIDKYLNFDLCKDCYVELGNLIKEFIGRDIEK